MTGGADDLARFIATPEAVARVGATPRFVDIVEEGLRRSRHVEVTAANLNFNSALRFNR